MSISDDEDECFARFLESEVSSWVEDEDKTKEPEPKRQHLEKDKTKVVEEKEDGSNKDGSGAKRIESGVFSNVPTELFLHIFKFLSSEDLLSCSLVCKYLNFAASDESLWRRLQVSSHITVVLWIILFSKSILCTQKQLLNCFICRYCIRWGLMPSTRMLRECAWKKLYIDRDEKDMIELVRSCPTDFKEYYVQMQAAKRSQAPLPSEMVDDRVVLDKTVLDKVSLWKKSKGLNNKAVIGHVCLGTKCGYHQIDDVFICEETGNVHVCDENCKEVIFCPDSGCMVCTISGLCSDSLVFDTDSDTDQEEAELEAEILTEKGRFDRAFEFGYNCESEQELERTFRFC